MTERIRPLLQLRFPAAIGCLVLFFLLAGTSWLYTGLWGHHIERELHLNVPRGASAATVLRKLRKLGVMESELPARIYLRVHRLSIRWGSYSFPPGASTVEILLMLSRGEVETISVTIPEGSRAEEIGMIIEKAGIRKNRPWKKILRENSWVADIAPEARSLEGFLFPDTYHFDSGLDTESVARHMVLTFHRVWKEERERVQKDGRKDFDILILASLVESETGRSSERARIAGVYVNRLRKGMLLQCDPTVIYALQRHELWKGQLRRKDLGLNDPYNTYLHPGLPPGPICNPGRAAIRAAMAPEKHSFLYFVADGNGGHSFSRSLREHNRAVARYRRRHR